MLYPNKTISVKRWALYATTVTTWLKVYIYELSDDLAIVNNIEGWQNMMKMMSRYSDIQVGDLLTDWDSIKYIVSKQTQRLSTFKKFYEYIIRKEND